MDDSYDSYRKAEEKCEQIRKLHPNIVADLIAAIDEYVQDRDYVLSNEAGSTLLKKQEGFRSIAGSYAPQVFGIIFRDHLMANGWVSSSDTVGRRKVTRYDRE